MWIIYFCLGLFALMIVAAAIKGLGLKTFLICVGVLCGLAIFILAMTVSVALGFLSLAIMIAAVFIYKAIKKNADEEKRIEEEKEKQKRLKEKNRLSFYNECKKNNWIEKLSEVDEQRRVLAAKKYGIDEKEIEFVISEQARLIEEKKNNESAKKAREEKEALELEAIEKFKSDAKEQQKMKTPYPYFGQEKPIAFWQKKINEENKIIAHFNNEMQKWQQAIDNVTHGKIVEKKIDWAVAGGIGSAIGGAGAGVMAALDAQAENARIEQRNQENIARAFEYVTDFLRAKQDAASKKYEHEKIVREYERKIEEIKMKLVDKIDMENPFDLISVKEVNVYDDELSITVALKKKAKIFGDVAAVVDGAFWAHVYQNNDYVGSVRVVLPYEGIDTTRKTISIGTSLGIDPVEECYIDYEAEKLWMIEK